MWGILISLFCSLFLLLENLVVRCRPLSQLWRAAQFVFSVAFIYQVFIFCVYWAGIFPYSKVHLWGASTPLDYSIYVTQHVVPALLLAVDFLVNPFVVWNFVHLPFYVALLAVYLALNCAYTLQVADIYMMVNYRNALTYAFLAACVAAILLCHLLVRLFCKFCKEGRVLWLLAAIRKQNPHMFSAPTVAAVPHPATAMPQAFLPQPPSASQSPAQQSVVLMDPKFFGSPLPSEFLNAILQSQLRGY